MKADREALIDKERERLDRKTDESIKGERQGVRETERGRGRERKRERERKIENGDELKTI